MQILLGVLVIAAAYLLSQVLRLTLIETLLEYLLQYGAIAALVVFQPELRTALSRLGQTRLLRLVNPMPENQLIDEIVHGVVELARKKTGAIIALEQEVGLDEYAQTGSRERVGVSAAMLQTIFTPGTPLHDGAVIIVGAEIRAAGAILPSWRTEENEPRRIDAVCCHRQDVGHTSSRCDRPQRGNRCPGHRGQ